MTTTKWLRTSAPKIPWMARPTREERSPKESSARDGMEILRLGKSRTALDKDFEPAEPGGRRPRATARTSSSEEAGRVVSRRNHDGLAPFTPTGTRTR